LEGIVIRSTGSWYKILLDDNSIIDCQLPGKFRLDNSELTNPVSVGDRVVIHKEATGTGVIKEIKERTNSIFRRSPKKKMQKQNIASNIDQATLIVTIKEPRTSLGFIDRFLLTTEFYEIPTIIIVNKSDLYKDKELTQYAQIESIYEPLGYHCILISLEKDSNVDGLIDQLNEKITLVVGHSGVGKSTFINYLSPDLDLKTQYISKHTNKGIHTTTHAEMFPLEHGGFIIDSPGLKEFGIVNLEPWEVSFYFREMKGLREECGFNNCLHVNEPKCAVIKAFNEGAIHASRYNSYLSIIEDLKEHQNIY